MGRIAKCKLQSINEEIRSATNVNQWRCTTTVIEWFKALEDKNDLKFLKFDIVEFYPSITEELLEDALNFCAKI